MKVCGYCGRQNEDNTAFCVECGTALEEETPSSRQVAALPLRKRLHELNAWSATAILLAYLSAEVICVIFMSVVAFFGVQAHGGYSPDHFESALRTLMPRMLVLVPISTGTATVLIARALIPMPLKDTSPIGAAWVRGRYVAILQGLVIGLVLGAGIYALSWGLKTHVDYRHVGPLGRMAHTRGLLQILCAVIVMLLAPFTEEILFRGVLYGGFRKSFGAFWATVLTTLLFCFLHLPAVAHFRSALLGVVLASLAALCVRLWWSAIGPAIAVHAGYNTVLFFFDTLLEY